MTTISTADLTSELVDISMVPLSQLRAATTPELTGAVRHAVTFSTTNKNEVQEQNQ